MKISTILDHIDSGHIALPEFQRGYVWNRDQVRGLLDSLYKRHPVGGLLVWVTESSSAIHRGGDYLAPGIVKLLLDGQQRMTSLYGVIRGVPPRFFDGNRQTFTGLYFHLENESFSFYMPMKMQDDPLWINVTDLMQKGNSGVGGFYKNIAGNPDLTARSDVYIGRISQLLGITEIDLHVEEVTGADKTLDVVVDIFNQVNSGGTKLSKGDLALAKICAEWPEARKNMKSQLEKWEKAGYNFNLDWLLRSVNTILTGEAKFQFLHNKSVEDISDGLNRANKHVDTCLNMIDSSLGLDHDQVFFGRYAIPVMVHYIDRLNGQMNERDRDKLLFWYLQAGMWGRFSGTTETYIDQDIAALGSEGRNLDQLVEQLRLWHGGLKVEAGHFTSWSLGARFYPILYMLTRTGEAKDWGTGVILKARLLGKMSHLEVHHIFPKAQLYKLKYQKPEVNALANYCFQTKETNLIIRDRLPEEYFSEFENAHPGALASQWIPMDKNLWKIENYREFLEARKILLAEETNKRLADLLHGETIWLEGQIIKPEIPRLNIGIETEGEENVLKELNLWLEQHSLAPGTLSYDFTDSVSGEQRAVLDLAWPEGIQEGLSQPVAILLNEGPDILSIASSAGFRCFNNTDEFKIYVKTEIIKEEFINV